jgi:hypothetical protein
VARPDADLQFDPTGCTVTAIEWPRRGFRMVLGGTTAAGTDVDGARLTFEEIANHDPLHTFLTAGLTYIPKTARRPYDHFKIVGTAVRLPAQLTHLRRSTAASVSYGDPAYGKYYGAARAGRGERLFVFALGVPRFKDRKPFPVVCRRVALVAADGTALGGAETVVPPPLPVTLLKRLGKQFAEAVLAGDDAAADKLLTPAARKRLGWAGLDRLLPRGWAATVRHYGGRKEAAAMIRKHLTVEAEPGGEAADNAMFTHAAPDVPPNSVRGVVTVYPYHPDTDVDPMCYLYFVGDGRDARIAHAEPN